jgi:hypothetical protein
VKKLKGGDAINFKLDRFVVSIVKDGIQIGWYCAIQGVTQDLDNASSFLSYPAAIAAVKDRINLVDCSLYVEAVTS